MKVRELLNADHATLFRLFDDVLALLEKNDRDVTMRAWKLFESGLNAHLEAEETLILPAFHAADRSEANAILKDHLRFRKTLDELGIAVELHTLRADVAKIFIDDLKAHAEREDARMYLWAEKNLTTLAKFNPREQDDATDERA
jgi:hemerythrin-like domain-containing protein